MAILDRIRFTEQLAELHRLIASWPGLVSDRDPALVEDSLVLLDLLEGASSLVDVGSGGGLPGLPLKLARPELRLTLVEANRKKAAFLTHAAAVLGLIGSWLLTEMEEFENRTAADLISKGETGRLWASLFYLRSGMPD